MAGAGYRNIMQTRLPGIALLLPLTLALTGCGHSEPAVTPLANADYNDSPGATPPASVLGENKDNKQQEAGTTLGVNAFLWRGALDTLSFMPLASADPFGGVIVTDWYAPPTTSGERFKATAYVLGRQLRADGVRVTVFRQVRAGGQWEDAPVNPGTVSDIENKVLARARELRSQQASK